MISDIEEVKVVESPLNILEAALQTALVNGKSKKEADFKEAYPLIEQNLAKKVPFKMVLELFNTAYGHKLHPPRFRKLLLDERQRRAVVGDELLCVTCGQAMGAKVIVNEQSNGVEGVNHD